MALRRTPVWLTIASFGWAVAPAVLLSWLAIHDSVPSGRLAAMAWPVRGPYLRGPVPESRVAKIPGAADGSAGYRLLAEPVYVDVQQPRPFRTLAVRLELDPGLSSVVELGVMPDGAADHMTLQPAYHRALEGLAEADGWPRSRRGNLTLFQRQPVYADVDAFLRQPPDPRRINVYRVPNILPFAAAALPPSGPATGTDFILTAYAPAEAIDGWRTVQPVFSLTAAQQSARTLRLVFSLPERPLPFAPASFRGLRVTLTGDRMSAAVWRGWLSRWF